MSHYFRLFAWIVLPLVVFAAGCTEPEPISTYTVEKPAEERPRIAPRQTKVTQAVRQPEQGKLVYDTPEGWKPAQRVEFADVSLTANNGNERAMITVSKMRVTPQLFAPNVNRWRGQVGLPPASPEDIDREMKIVEVGDSTALFFNFVGPEANGRSETILSAILPGDDGDLIVKLRGESKLAAREKENFLSFLPSLRYE